VTAGIPLETAVPVTAKLSKQFYERLGDQVVNELAEWLNRVDATYKGELREINELNFARFNAHMDQRFAEFDIRFAQFEARMEKRMSEFEARIEKRMGDFEVRMSEFEVRIEKRLGAFEVRMSEFEVRIEKRLGEFEVRIERGFKEQTRWMFVAWTSLMIPIIGLWFR
jgi:hypothetical protein